MRNLIVKIERSEKDRVELGIYWKRSPNGFYYQDLTLYFDQSEGEKGYLTKVGERWGEKEETGFLCAHCKAPCFHGRADGHIETEMENFGLCGMCGSAQEIFERYITHDVKGEYIPRKEPKWFKREMRKAPPSVTIGPSTPYKPDRVVE